MNNLQPSSRFRTDRLGRYYLYFAYHGGHYIRMARADQLTGPWTVLPEPGVLHMDAGPGIKHVASPDVHVPDVHGNGRSGQWRMYFHMPVEGKGQLSFVALSRDGLHWQVQPQELGWFYFRAFEYQGAWHAYAKDTVGGGLWCRSDDGLTPFEEGAAIVPFCRHAAVWVEGDMLHLFYSLAEDTPERILVSRVDLTQPWQQWQPGAAEVVLEPTRDWEGGNLALEPSRWGASKGTVRQLRDPAIYQEGDGLFLLYTGAGESNICIARLLPR